MFQTVIIALNEGFLKTFEIFCVTLLGALPLGLIIAFGSMSRWRPLKWFVKTLVWVVRGTPLMLQLLIIFYGPGKISAITYGARATGAETPRCLPRLY